MLESTLLPLCHEIKAKEKICVFKMNLKVFIRIPLGRSVQLQEICCSWMCLISKISHIHPTKLPSFLGISDIFYGLLDALGWMHEINPINSENLPFGVTG